MIVHFDCINICNAKFIESLLKPETNQIFLLNNPFSVIIPQQLVIFTENIKKLIKSIFTGMQFKIGKRFLHCTIRVFIKIPKGIVKIEKQMGIFLFWLHKERC